MLKERVPETNEGIQDHLTVEVFDRFARNMRDRGWNNVGDILQTGIAGGEALEIGPGPGYIGLEWLKRAPQGALTGLEISPEMLRLAQKNAAEYGLSDRVRYVRGSCLAMPFTDGGFDAVFSNGSLHEWEDPIAALREILRVLKPGGRFCVTDMRRDVPAARKWMIYLSTRPRQIRPGFLTSLAAAYTAAELTQLAQAAGMTDFAVENAFFGLRLAGRKAG